MTTTAEKNTVALTEELQYCHDYFKHLFHTNFFKCMNDETRQKVILLASQSGEDGMRVADIAEHFELDRTTVSHHLAMLRDNNLMMMAKRGKERYYSVNTDYLIGVLEEMTNILKSCSR